MKDAQLAPSEKQSLTKSADGRMATEAARLKQKTSDKKKKNQLDTSRPSHGRTWESSGDDDSVEHVQLKRCSAS
jgi:hypothetical protein